VTRRIADMVSIHAWRDPRGIRAHPKIWPIPPFFKKKSKLARARRASFYARVGLLAPDRARVPPVPKDQGRPLALWGKRIADAKDKGRHRRQEERSSP
jgi:hypothetical protein